MKAKHMKMLLIVAAIGGALYYYRRRQALKVPLLPASNTPALPNVNNTRSWASTAI